MRTQAIQRRKCNYSILYLSVLKRVYITTAIEIIITEEIEIYLKYIDTEGKEERMCGRDR